MVFKVSQPARELDIQVDVGVSRLTEPSTGESGSGALGNQRGRLWSGDDGNFHVQPADKDLGTIEGVLAVYCGRCRVGLGLVFRPSCLGAGFGSGEEALGKRCQPEEQGRLDHLF